MLVFIVQVMMHRWHQKLCHCLFTTRGMRLSKLTMCWNIAVF